MQKFSLQIWLVQIECCATIIGLAYVLYTVYGLLFHILNMVKPI